MIDTVQVERDAEGLQKAFRELFEEAFCQEVIRPMVEKASEETRNRALEDVPERTLSPGYYTRAEYLLELASAIDCGVQYSCTALDRQDVIGLQRLKRARHEFEFDHPACACGTRQHNRFILECRSCGAKFKPEARLMASVVEIQIKIDNSQAVPSLDQIANSMGTVGTAAKTMGSVVDPELERIGKALGGAGDRARELDRIAYSMGSMGRAAKTMGFEANPELERIARNLGSLGAKNLELDRIAKSLGNAGSAGKEMGGHMATSLDAVRLLSQEFGLRLPRAIESMLSRMPGVTAALGSMLGVMAAIAAAQVFVHLAEEAYHLYNQYISLTAASDKYYESLNKAREADFGNPRDLETGIQRLQQATQVASQLHAQAVALQKVNFFDSPAPL